MDELSMADYCAGNYDHTKVYELNPGSITLSDGTKILTGTVVLPTVYEVVYDGETMSLDEAERRFYAKIYAKPESERGIMSRFMRRLFAP